MKKFSKMKVLLIGSAIFIIIYILYLIIDLGMASVIIESYSKLTGQHASNFGKSSKFLSSYIISTGDTTLAVDLGMSKDDISKLISSKGVSATQPTVIKDDDWLDVVKYIASTVFPPALQEEKNNSNTEDHDDGYSVTIGGQIYRPDGDTKGRECFSCCCCIAEGTLYYMDAISASECYHTAGIGSYSGSESPDGCETLDQFIARGLNNPDYNLNTYQNIVFGDLPVGTVIGFSGKGGNGNTKYRICHVAIVVKREGDIVYIADGGNAGWLEKMMTDGYAYSVKGTENVHKVMKTKFGNYRVEWLIPIDDTTSQSGYTMKGRDTK